MKHILVSRRGLYRALELLRKCYRWDDAANVKYDASVAEDKLVSVIEDALKEEKQ